MKASKLAIFLVVLALKPALASSTPAAVELAAKSVTKLERLNPPACGSGFVVGLNLVATNAHVAQAICSNAQCSDKHSTISYAADLAILESASTEKPLEFAEAKKGEAVWAIGFPACGEKTISPGSIIDIQGPYVLTSTKGLHGSSGSAVVNEQGKLVAIVSQADSLSGAIGSIIGGSAFNNRAILSNYLNDLINRPQNTLTRVPEDLFSYYRQYVLPLTGPIRLVSSLRFLGSVNGLQSDLFDSNSSSAAELRLASDQAKSLGGLAGLNLSVAQANSLEQAHLLLIAAAAERHSLTASLGVPLNVEDFLAQLRKQGWSDTHLEQVRKLLFDFEISKFPGLEATTVAAILAGFVVCGVLAIWFWSLGYVFGSANGGFFKRIGTMLLVGIFWPFSLIFYRGRPRPKII